ncbi:MAG TPA: ATP-binding protein [Bacteroidia bacterium]|nr:ATP-binding protein [Bacteroidia bacterium]HRS57999.1 ATP-binding protein [Bacteroidia bacterium]HRU69260.1 ATP-binding protein [Bacteroidia bacterium]
MLIFDREIEKTIDKIRGTFPSITITGPRQSGKTTLVKKLFPDLPYFSFENPDIRRIVKEDPRSFLSQIKTGAILDEIQNVPELLSYLQEIIDQNNEKLTYIITGSNQFSLISDITQTLAGRTAMLKLLPLSLSELEKYNLHYDLNEILFRGFYPAIHSKGFDVYITYSSYYETYIERDVRRIINLKDIDKFQRFIRLCAGRIGELLNMSNLANETGVSVPTINHWISVLQASYVIFLLRPFYENINKRLVKTPKLYFYDTGLASYLLGVENSLMMSREPRRAALFENLIVSECLKSRYNEGKDSNLFFFRDKTGNEVDLIIRLGSSLKLIEIKSSMTFHSDFLKPLKYASNLFSNKEISQYLIYSGDIEQEVHQVQVINYNNIGRKVL